MRKNRNSIQSARALGGSLVAGLGLTLAMIAAPSAANTGQAHRACEALAEITRFAAEQRDAGVSKEEAYARADAAIESIAQRAMVIQLIESVYVFPDAAPAELEAEAYTACMRETG